MKRMSLRRILCVVMMLSFLSTLRQLYNGRKWQNNLVVIEDGLAAKRHSLGNVLQKGTEANRIHIEETVVLDPKSSSLFSKYGLSDLKMLKPLDIPRPKFNILTAPNITRGIPKWLANHEITLSMVIAIKSNYKSYAQRLAIRDSWGGIGYINGARMHVVFVLALPKTPEDDEFVKLESLKFGDILQVDIEENYRNVGLKVMASMQWVCDNFPDHWLYFSADEDIVPDFATMFSNLRTLLEEAVQIGSVEKNLPMYCAFGFDEFPGVLRTGKWTVSHEEYPNEFYPSICLGGFYGLTVKLTRAIYNASRHYPFFRHDDVFLTGFMRYAVCDSAGDELNFNRSDPFCAISKIRNSNFEHVPIDSRTFMKRWDANQEKLIKGGAKIVRKPAR